jgi:thiamine biosynthesis protein ThiI
VTAAEEPGPDVLLVRYGELALKGRNRSDFERQLLENVRAALRHVTPVRMERGQGRIAVWPEQRAESAARRLQDVFGIASISAARSVANEPGAIVEVARSALREAVGELAPGSRATFRVATRRADKGFPIHSADFDRYVADHLLGEFPMLDVQLKGSALTLGIDIRPERTYVFARRLPGPGGLPVGTQGRVLCLISGGFDSPVAGWLCMKRGCEVQFVTFHSHPFIGEPARKKVVDLVRVLARYQPRVELNVVPFAECQLAIRALGQASYRTVLYRRMMQRIATALAARTQAAALVTGDSLGQVASQTLENLTCIGAAAGLPVLRPLIGFDKQETIALARRIGTHDLSAVQEPDCCTLFMPSRPVIRGRVETCAELEAELAVEPLVARALEQTERLTLEADV